MTLRATIRGAHEGLLPPLAVDPELTDADEAFRGHQVLVVAPGIPATRADGAGTTSSAPASGVIRREVVVDGWRFEVDVEAERRAELRERAARDRGGAGQSGPVEVRAIIPGVVVSVAVAAGDAVAAGQELLVVEAMKMQNELRAPRAGRVARVAVGERSTIEVGDVLVVIE